MPRRFEQLVDPCGNWMVWDRSAEMPATYEGQILAGLAADDAGKLAMLLNLMCEMEETGEVPGQSSMRGKQTGAA